MPVCDAPLRPGAPKNAVLGAWHPRLRGGLGWRCQKRGFGPSCLQRGKQRFAFSPVLPQTPESPDRYWSSRVPRIHCHKPPCSADTVLPSHFRVPPANIYTRAVQGRRRTHGLAVAPGSQRRRVPFRRSPEAVHEPNPFGRRPIGGFLRKESRLEASPSGFRPSPLVPGFFSFRARVIFPANGPTRPTQRLPMRRTIPPFPPPEPPLRSSASGRAPLFGNSALSSPRGRVFARLVGCLITSTFCDRHPRSAAAPGDRRQRKDVTHSQNAKCVGATPSPLRCKPLLGSRGGAL